MTGKFSYVLILLIICSSAAKAQNYSEQYLKCSEQLKVLGTNVDSVYFARLRERDSCLTGSIAPNFTATSVDGQKIELSKLKGQIVFLNFWFTRCQPCIREMPALNNLVKYYSGKPVQFISFAPEDASAVRTFLQKQPFNFTAIANSENIRRDTFKLFSAWPYSIIIDPQGRIAKIWFSNKGEGVFEFYKEVIDNLLRK
jgi:peroxiredoxin